MPRSISENFTQKLAVVIDALRAAHPISRLVYGPDAYPKREDVLRVKSWHKVARQYGGVVVVTAVSGIIGPGRVHEIERRSYHRDYRSLSMGVLCLERQADRVWGRGTMGSERQADRV